MNVSSEAASLVCTVVLTPALPKRLSRLSISCFEPGNGLQSWPLDSLVSELYKLKKELAAVNESVFSAFVKILSASYVIFPQTLTVCGLFEICKGNTTDLVLNT